MKNIKRFFCLLTLVLLSLVLLAGCGSSDSDESDTYEIDGYGTVKRNGENTLVCVGHDRKTIYLYNYDEENKLFDTAEIPSDIYDEDWFITKFSFSDWDGDGNSDLQVTFYHSDMSESNIHWTWVEGEGYVYQWAESRLYDSIVVRYPDDYDSDAEFGDKISMYVGVWLSDEDNQYDDAYIEFGWYGYWTLYAAGELVDEGSIRFEPEGDYLYSDSYNDSAIDGSRIELEGDRIYINTLGYFNNADGMEDNRNSADEPEDEPADNLNSAVKTEEYDGSYDWNEKLEQRNVSHFEGTWYLDAELWSLNYIIIDGNGNWSYYQRPSEDDEGTEMDYGTLTYSKNEERTYYAESDLYDGLRFKVVEFVEGIFDWGDDGTYYLMDGTEDDYYDWNAKLHQVNVSHFEGVWYYDYDTSADTYITIDGDGNWSFYQRSSGNTKDSVIDYGTLTYSTDEDSMYYADSALYEGVRYMVFWFDDNILVWGDEGAYCLMD